MEALTDREKLIDMLCEVEAARAIGTSMERCADHLISNGVVVLEKGEWESIGCKPHLIYVCSLCGDQWSYGAMFHFNFCPNCGADMRKGENG